MLRLTDIKLPLDHSESALAEAILARLGIGADELTGYTVARRSHDARKRGGIVLIYSVDVETPRETELLRQWQGVVADKPAPAKVMPTPDTSYKFVTQACGDLPLRPIVIGTGPCGLFAGLLAQMGSGRIWSAQGIARAHGRHVRCGAKDPQPGATYNRRGRGGHVLHGKLYSQISDRLHHGRKC